MCDFEYPTTNDIPYWLTIYERLNAIRGGGGIEVHKLVNRYGNKSRVADIWWQIL